MQNLEFTLHEDKPENEQNFIHKSSSRETRFDTEAKWSITSSKHILVWQPVI